MNINKTNELITPSKLTLDNPGRLQGGSYYCKIKYDNQPFYIQTPVVYTKNGIKETSKKTYCDIMFEQTDNLTTYLEDLESHLKSILYEKSKLWFYNDLDEDDIDMFYRSCVRNYKFKYLLLRTYVNKKRGENKDNIQIYDEDEILRNKEDVLNKSVIAIIKPKGVTFTTTSFSLDIELVQLMIINNDSQFSKCMIKNDVTQVNETNEQNTEEIVDNQQVNDENIIENESVEETQETNTQELEYQENEILEPKIQETEGEQENIKDVDIESPDSGIVVLEQLNTLENTENSIDESNENNKDDTNTLENTEIDTGIVLEEDETNKEVESNIPNETEKDVSLEIDTIHLDNIANNNEIMEEVRLGIEDIDRTNDESNIKLKDPRDVYYELYEEAYKKARLAKKIALQAYLEARQIKNQYLLDDTVTSSDDEDEDEEDLENISVYSEEELVNTLNTEY